MRKLIIEATVMNHNSDSDFVGLPAIKKAIDGFELEVSLPSQYELSPIDVTLKFTEVEVKE